MTETISLTSRLNSCFNVIGSNSIYRLLTASVLISFVGFCRIYIAHVFLGTSFRIELCAGFFLVVYSVYTFDRSIECKEDMINKRGYGNGRRIGITTSLILFVIGFILTSKYSIIAPFVPLMVGTLYTKGIKIFNKKIKLKRGYGVKNMVVAFTWALTITLFMKSFNVKLLSLLPIFVLFFSKSFINSTINDFRDIKGDKLAGIKTIPILLGIKKSKIFLSIVHVIFHIIFLFFMLYEFIVFNLYFYLTSLIFGLLQLKISDKNGFFKSLITDGGSILSVFFYHFGGHFNGISEIIT